MDIKWVPILSDAIKAYYSDGELIELCDLFDVELEFEDNRPAHMRLARQLVTQKEHGNHGRLLEALVASLLNQACKGSAYSKFERKDYHQDMVNQLADLEKALGEGKIPTEISVPEAHPFKAKSETREFLSKAETTVTIVDNYVGLGTLDCLRDIQQPIKLLTGEHINSIEKGFDRAFKEFQAEEYLIELRLHHKLHDRYILFNSRCWLVGSTLKDAGKKILNMIECIDIKAAIVGDIEKKWKEAKEYQV